MPPTSKCSGHSCSVVAVVRHGPVPITSSITSTPNAHHAPKRRTSASSTASGSSTGAQLPACRRRRRTSPTGRRRPARPPRRASRSVRHRGLAAPLVDEQVDRRCGRPPASSPNAGVARPPGAGRSPNRPVTACRRRASTWTANAEAWRVAVRSVGATIGAHRGTHAVIASAATVA